VLVLAVLAVLAVLGVLAVLAVLAVLGGQTRAATRQCGLYAVRFEPCSYPSPMRRTNRWTTRTLLVALDGDRRLLTELLRLDHGLSGNPVSKCRQNEQADLSRLRWPTLVLAWRTDLPATAFVPRRPGVGAVSSSSFFSMSATFVSASRAALVQTSRRAIVALALDGQRAANLEALCYRVTLK